MSMFAWSNRLLRCQSGAPAVEFALAAPLFLLVFVGIIEVSSMLEQNIALEKGLRAAAEYAGRSALNGSNELDSAEVTAVKNVAMYGNAAGTGTPRVLGWTDPASITITYDHTQLSVADSPPIVVIQFSATTPYRPVVPGLFDFGLFTSVSGFTLNAEHEQAHIGTP